MPAKLRPADPGQVAAALAVWRSGSPSPEALRLLTKHFLALLSAAVPGRAVEVRVPPYAAVQVLEGPRHTRGRPPAVVELDADTWIALATGAVAWAAAESTGRINTTGERADLSAYLPLA